MRRRKKKTPGDSGAATQASPLQPVYPEEQQPSGEMLDVTSEPGAAVGEAAVETSSPAERTEETPAPAPRSRRRRKKKPAQPAEQAPPAETAEQPEPTSPEVDDLALGGSHPVTETTEPSSHAEQPSAPAVEPAPDSPRKPQRASKGAVVLAVGLPGSGKSTWYKRRGVTPLSSDAVRQLLFDDPTVQHHQDLVFGTLRSLLRARLIARMPMNYVDATNLSPKERRHWIKMARDFGYEVQAVYFDVPLEVCIERNRRRNRIVPDDVMHRMAAKLKPPTFDEGFSKIIVVRVKQRAPEAAAEPERHAGEQERAIETE
jgi:predicted kinase